jgi:hypothetical protein
MRRPTRPPSAIVAQTAHAWHPLPQVAAGLASWAVDFCAVVCSDAAVLSDDPGSTRLLSEEAAAAWCRAAADATAAALRQLLAGEGGGGGGSGAELEKARASAEALAHVACALRGAPGGGRWARAGRTALRAAKIVGCWRALGRRQCHGIRARVWQRRCRPRA